MDELLSPRFQEYARAPWLVAGRDAHLWLLVVGTLCGMCVISCQDCVSDVAVYLEREVVDS